MAAADSSLLDQDLIVSTPPQTPDFITPPSPETPVQFSPPPMRRTLTTKTDADLTEKDAKAARTLPFIDFIDQRLVFKACGRCAGCRKPDCGECKACLKNKAEIAAGRNKSRPRHRCERKVCYRRCGHCEGCLRPDCGECASCLRAQKERAETGKVSKDCPPCERKFCVKSNPANYMAVDAQTQAENAAKKAKLQVEINKCSVEIAQLSDKPNNDKMFNEAMRKLNDLRSEMKTIGTRNRKSKIKSRFGPGFLFHWSTIQTIENIRKTLARGVLTCNSQHAQGVEMRRRISEELSDFLMGFARNHVDILTPQGEDAEFKQLLGLNDS